MERYTYYVGGDTETTPVDCAFDFEDILWYRQSPGNNNTTDVTFKHPQQQTIMLKYSFEKFHKEVEEYKRNNK